MAVGGEPAVKEHGVLAEEEAAVAADWDSETEINWVEMPVSNVRWVLGRKRERDPVPKLKDYGIYTQEDLDKKDADMLIRRAIASLQVDQDDFFEYQAWVREVFLRNRRVMVTITEGYLLQLWVATPTISPLHFALRSALVKLLYPTVYYSFNSRDDIFSISSISLPFSFHSLNCLYPSLCTYLHSFFFLSSLP